MNILFLDTTHSILIKALRDLGHSCDEDYTSDIEVIYSKIKNYDGIIIRSRFKIDRKFIDYANNLKFIARIGAGMENIDLEYAESKRINCLHAPEGNRTAVAEHSIAMLLCLFNNIIKADNEVRNNIWQREVNRGIELEGKTVAIFGYGNMGSAFAKILQGFGVEILCYDAYKKNYIDNTYSTESNLENIFEKADIVSMHIPYSKYNHYYVNEKFLNSFRKPIFIINTSRGKILNTADLVLAIENKKVLGACLDVLEFESISFEKVEEAEPLAFSKLKQMKNVVLTPHIAGWTHESNTKMAEIIISKIQKFKM